MSKNSLTDREILGDRFRVNRRTFLATGSASLGLALAGCVGGDGDDEEEPDEDDSTDDEDDTTDDGTDTSDDEDDENDDDDDEAEDWPDPEDTETAIIEPATLKEWQDAGLVNLDELDERKRVVVFRVWDTDLYEDGHVPGAQKWGPNEFHAARVEGLAEAAPMVPDGEQMDEILQRSGVCPKTTIVLSGPSALRTARAYWTLRYWGFPRERVKILDGGYHAYGEEFDLEEGDEPDAPDADFSVEANDGLNNDLRLGIAQAIQRVDLKHEGERDDVFLDNRPDPSSTIATAVVDDPANYHEGDSYSTTYEEGGTWKSPDDVESHIFGLDGVEDGDTIVTYCGSGYRATMGFVALDAILGYDDVAVYDGSFSRQWAHYDGNNDEANTPPDEWRVDLSERTDGDTGDSDLEIVVDEIPALEDPEANQIEQADLEYMGEADDGGGDWGCGARIATAAGD